MQRRTMLAGGGALLAAGVIGAVVVGRQTGSMESHAALSEELRQPLPPAPDDRALIRFATLAANGHNTQPWRFQVAGQAYRILPDFARRTPVVDPDDHHLFASLGCAAENLAIAATAQARAATVQFDPAGGGAVIVETAPAGGRDPLLAAIPHRQSTRSVYDGSAASPAELRLLETAGRLPGVDLVVLPQGPALARVRDLVIAGNSAQMANPAFVAELKAWLRFNPVSAAAHRDGLFSACSGNPSAPSWLGPALFDLTFKADAENDRYAAQLDSSAGVAVFLGERDDPAHWVQAGRACQRFALQATVLGIKTAFVNQPVEEAGLRPELAALAGLPGRRPDIVMRFGRGPALPMSLRRAVDAVIVA